MIASKRQQVSQGQGQGHSSASNEAHSRKQKLTTSKGFQRHFAKHDYHDFAHCQPSELGDLHLKPIRGGVQSPFPVILHRMLEDSVDKNFADIVSWQPHGRAFLIRHPKEFVASVLPKYFKHSKLSSFQRQLSLYGFIRLTNDGADRGAYYHEAFLRGREFLCSKIRRTRIKGTWIRTSSSPTEEPNFYLMEPVFDLLNAANKAAPPSNTNWFSNIQAAVSVEDSSAQSSDTPLQAPPLLPSHVVRPLVSQNVALKSAPTMQWPPKVVHCDSTMTNQLLGLASFPLSTNLTDNDLAQFLTGVDLDAEHGLSDVVQMSPV
ncbi:MAG: hypothetical protein SGBAC_004810 [Bacillariaceae sp.]